MDEDKYMSDRESIGVFLNEDLFGYSESDIMWNPDGEYYFVIGETDDGKKYQIHIPSEYTEYCDFVIGMIIGVRRASETI